MSETGNKVIPIDIVREMRDSYLDYAMSVIVDRALPDVRDGLKPVHRRLLFAMHELGLYAGSRFRKSALVVGDVLGKYHPHGDSACYGALVRLAQDFSMRYPLVTGQGNFGSVDGDSAAAMRYTEVKMASLADEILRDIDRETVDFRPNYDGTRQEPTLLPVAIPNLLLNGSMGIAVGMATKIAPHNLTEIMNALIALADNADLTTADLMEHVKGPDFPTGGLIFKQEDIAHALSTGRGGVLCRGEVEIAETKAGSAQLIIKSLPYQINKAELQEKIADLVREKKIEGIKDIRDESTTLSDTRVVIELKGGAYPEKVKNALYKHTELETMFHYNMLALVDGVPRLLSLKGMLTEFISHRQIIVERRTRFDLRKAEEREHILLGLKIALDHIDEVIKTIRGSADTPTAHKNLVKKFELSDRQAEAILEMKLQKLAGLERQKIEDELKEKQALIKELKALLADKKKILAVVKKEFTEIRDKYGDERRTKVVKSGVREISDADLVPEKENVLVLTRGGYVKRTDPLEYRAQKRGGVGVIDLDVKEEDFVNLLLNANTHDDLLFFSDRGKAYQIKMYDIPEGKRATRGKSVMNFLSFADTEKTTSILPLSKENKKVDVGLVMITKQGTIKKVKASSFHDVRRSGIMAIKLDSNDELLSALLAPKGSTIIIGTKLGQSIRFKEADIREMGRTAMGVRAIKLGKNDEVIGADIVTKDNQDSTYFVMTGNGFGKKTAVKEYKVQGRGGSGIKTAKITTKTGPLMIGRVIVGEETEIIAISRQGQIIRTKLDEIPTLGRQTQGVRIMKVRDGDALASMVCL
ncbi:MAG: DNA gyrase subunit A [Patescibacteria group bacterium]